MPLKVLSQDLVQVGSSRAPRSSLTSSDRARRQLSAKNHCSHTLVVVLSQSNALAY